MGETLEGRETSRFGMEMPEFKTPAAGLMAGVLADDAIEPAFETACQAEIAGVDRQHERIVEHGAIEPIRYDQIDAVGISMRVGALGPLIDPREAMQPPLVGPAQRCRDRRRLQSVERRPQAVIIARARATADKGQ